MTRRKVHTPLQVLLNNHMVGRLEKEPGGAIRFRYDSAWLDAQNTFAISRTLPLRAQAFRGASVVTVFENLLPDNDDIRRRVAERTGAAGMDTYSLLERIGRDCVGALRFLPDDAALVTSTEISGEALDEASVEQMLANLYNAPLGMDDSHDFRLSVAGAQEKTALLFYEGQWMRPRGTTPTTHILKPQIGKIPTASGIIDLSNSVDNEHYCLRLLEAFGLTVAKTRIATFGQRRVLVVERFDRRWEEDGRLIRLPQEDICQALGLPSSQKYQSHGGPDAVAILHLLQEANDPRRDQVNFLKSQIIFWLIGATDGHAKNFSLALHPKGGFALTPFYDVLSTQPAFDHNQIRHNSYKLAMSAGDNRYYKILDIQGRHFVETAKKVGLGTTLIQDAIHDILNVAPIAADKALAQMPGDFAQGIHTSINRAINERVKSLEKGL